jgi:hypothetical protein
MTWADAWMLSRTPWSFGSLWVLGALEYSSVSAAKIRAAVDETRVQELLDELSDSSCTPREVFGACPELLPEVHEGVYSALRQVRPKDQRLWIGRGRYHALRDRRRLTAADHDLRIEPSLPPDKHFESACLLLLIGDQGRYWGLVQTLGEEVDKRKKPLLASELARACIVTS